MTSARAWSDRLVCPECRARLRQTDFHLHCPACPADYEVRGGVPVLLTARDAGKFAHLLGRNEALTMREQYRAPAQEARPGRLRRLITPPLLLLNQSPQLRGAVREALYESRGKRTLVISVGGGPTRDDPREVNLNIGLFPNVDVVGSGACIPFADGSFDSAVCKAVLEHVDAPWTIAAEMVRVVRPGGLVYVETPFIFPYHAYPSDYFRYTTNGLAALFPGLSEVESGIVQGPTSALLELANAWLVLLLADGRPRLRKAVSGLFRWAFFGLKHVDRLLNRKPGARQIAAGVYWMGRKP